MTFIVGLVLGNGVLMVSDSRATLGYIAEEQRKLHPIYFVDNGKEIDLAVVGGSGDATLVKQAFQLIERAFIRAYKSVGDWPHGAHVAQLIDSIQMELVEKYSRLRELGLRPNVSLMLGTVTKEGEPRLYVFDDKGIYEPRHDNPGYAMIGIGRDTGGELLLYLLGFSREKAENWDPGILTTFLIDVVASVNPFVSPITSALDSILIRKEKDKIVMGPLKTKAFLEYKRRAEKRLEIIRKLWDILEEVEDEDVVLRALEKIKKENADH